MSTRTLSCMPLAHPTWSKNRRRTLRTGHSMAIDETLCKGQEIRASRNEDGSGSMKRRCGLALRIFRRAVGLRAAIPILIVAAVSCGRVSEPGQHAAVGVAFPFGERIGW